MRKSGDYRCISDKVKKEPKKPYTMKEAVDYLFIAQVCGIAAGIIINFFNIRGI
jgi:hypothetical protein